MYNSYFGFSEKPFTIAPNPHFLFMSKRHQEALAHMLYGLQGEGGIMVLTGEVGTGKTTLCRSLLKQLPENTNVAYIINPKQSENEILASLCDELHITYDNSHNIKELTDALNQYLLDAHANGQHTMLIIDEAQNLEIAVLEQLRLLTNLETNDKKLLQIMLLGQPELSDILQRKDLRQLAQRITSRYHLTPLDQDEVTAYVKHRLAIAGYKNQKLFPKAVLHQLYHDSGGIPRLINLLADRALLGAYASENKQVNKAIFEQAKQEVLGETAKQSSSSHQSTLPYLLVLSGLFIALWFWSESQTSQPQLAALAKPPTPTRVQGKENTQPSKLISKVYKTVTPPPELITESVSQPMPSTLSLNQAFIPIFKAWGIAYQPAIDGDACNFASTHHLQCLRQRGDIAVMRGLDRPSVLTVSNHNGEKAYTAITSLSGATAQVAMQDTYTNISLHELALQSHNDFTLLWKAPQGYQGPVRPGQQGNLVALLADQVTQALQQSWIGSPRTIYDDVLKEQVKILQRQEGLNPDGVAGPLTWIHINNLNQLDTPNLQTQSSR